MSVFTQFTGNAVPFGQLIGLWDNRNNPTIDGIEYLKSGVLKSSTGYSSLVSNWPSLGLNAPTGSSYALTVGNAPTFYLTDGTRYYVLSNGPLGNYGTNVTSSWSTAVTSATNALDACRFGTSSTLIIVGANASTNQYIIGTTATTIPTTTVTMLTVASNTAGTLAVLCGSVNNAANSIWTSTNGTSWTSRTPTGSATASNIVRAMWSTVGNCFVYLDATAVAWTTTDGYTLTSRGTPTNLAAASVSSVGQGNNRQCASSASSTLFTVTQSGVSYIVKTTNGTSFTATSVSSLFGAYSALEPALVYLNSAYYAIFPVGVTDPAQGIFKSTDEGATWNVVPKIFLSPYVFSGTTSYYLDYLALMNGNIIAFVRAGATTNGAYGVLSSYDTVNYIGVPNATTQPTASSGSDVNNPNTYVRIK